MTQPNFHKDALDNFLVRSLNQKLDSRELKVLISYIQNDQEFRKYYTTWVSLLREFDWPEMTTEKIGE